MIEEGKLRLFDESDLEAIMKPFQELADNAMKKIKQSGKRPIELIEDYLNTKIKKDPLLVKQLLRVCLSAYTNEPINVGLLAPSSEGKTYATVQVTEIFPQEDVISVGRISPTALIHQHGVLVDSEGNSLKERLDKLQIQIFEAEKDNNRKEVFKLKQIRTDMLKIAKNLVDLNHKILLFLDNPSTQTYELLKPIMSHDKKEIVYKTTKGDGSLTVKETIIRGWPAVIVCSAKNEAKNEVWSEIATREIILSPNTDVTKYHAANKLTSVKMGMPTLLTNNDKDKVITKFYVARIKDSLTKLCKDDNNVVFNVLHEKIANLFPHNEGITMRHLKRLMSFINIETLINANSKMKIEFKEHNKEESQIFVVTSLKSIADAIKILGNIASIAPQKIKFYNEIFVPLIKEKITLQVSLDDDSQQRFVNTVDPPMLTANEIASKYTTVYKKPVTPKQIQENYLKPLTDEGILDWKLNPENKRQYLYFISGKLTVNNLDELNRQLIDSVDNHFAYIWSCLAKLFQLSMKVGKFIRIFDNSNPKINYNEFQKKISGNNLKCIDN